MLKVKTRTVLLLSGKSCDSDNKGIAAIKNIIPKNLELMGYGLIDYTSGGHKGILVIHDSLALHYSYNYLVFI